MLPDVPYIPGALSDWSAAHENALREWLDTCPTNAREALLLLLDAQLEARRAHKAKETPFDQAQDAAADAIVEIDMAREALEEALTEKKAWANHVKKIKKATEQLDQKLAALYCTSRKKK